VLLINDIPEKASELSRRLRQLVFHQGVARGLQPTFEFK
jgi:hypothetical protein